MSDLAYLKVSSASLRFSSLDLVLVEEVGVGWVREVLTQVILRSGHLVGLRTRMLIELLQDVEKLHPVLLLLFVFLDEAMVLEELLLPLSLVQILGLFRSSSSHEGFRLVISLINGTWFPMHFTLELFEIPALESIRANMNLLVFESYWIGVLFYLFVLLFDDGAVGKLFIKSILVLDRLVEGALHVWLLLELSLLAGLYLFPLLNKLPALEDKRVILLNGGL